MSSAQNILVTNDACFIDDKIGALRQTVFRIEYAVGGQRFEIRKVTEYREVELEKISERFLREGRVGADRHNFGIHFFELVIVVATGRQLLYSSRRKIENVELDKNVFRSLKATQFQLAALGAGQLEVGRFVAYLDGRNRWRPCKS